MKRLNYLCVFSFATIMFILYIYEAALKKYARIVKKMIMTVVSYLIISIALQLMFDINYIESVPVFIVILSSLSSIGIMLFLLLVVIDTIIYFGSVIEKEAETKYLRTIAYNDPLTNGLNRAAFERDIDFLLKKDNKMPFRLSMFDLNELKKINDKYGHEEGDEFMVIQMNTSEDMFMSLLDDFKSHLKLYENTKGYVLEAAFGSDIYKYDESFGEFKHRVDIKMYSKKSRQKKIKLFQEE